MVMFDLKDVLAIASSLKLLIYDAEYLLEVVFSRLILPAFTPQSLRLNSASSYRRVLQEEDWSMAESMNQ